MVRNVYNYKTTACMDLSLGRYTFLHFQSYGYIHVPIATAQYDTLSFPEEPGDVKNRYGLQ